MKVGLKYPNFVKIKHPGIVFETLPVLRVGK
jgi:hypothetical protein